MLHRKKPIPLFQFLQENGFDYKIRQVQHAYRDENSWEIVIWNKHDSSVNEYCLNSF